MDSSPTSKPFPGFDRVYRLGELDIGRAFRAKIQLLAGEDFAVTRGEVRPTKPVSATWKMGRTAPSDVIGTTLSVPLLISQRVVNLLNEIGARGWSTYDVQLSGKDGKLIEGYHGLAIHGRCGPIDDSRTVKF
jgi:hypothetical protein